MSTEYTAEYTALLNKLTIQGEGDKIADRPAPANSLLWATARRLGGDAHLPIDVRDDMLADLRDAYDQGFDPNHFDLARIAAEVAKLGVNAELVDTSGGAITLYCGTKVEDQNGEDRWAVSAGPGYEHSSDRVWAHIDEFSYGPHDYSSDSAKPEPGTPAKTIARRILQIVQLVEGKRMQLANARLRVPRIAEEAELAMWEVIAKRLPECTSGDFEPGAAYTFSQMIESAVRCWLDTNFGSTLHDLPQPVPTQITEVPSRRSQLPLVPGGEPCLIHNGEDWSATFQTLLWALVDERLADPEPCLFFPAVVFYGAAGDDVCTRAEGLIVERDGGWLHFDDGFMVDTGSVLSIHVN